MSEREEKFEKMLQAVREEYGTVSEKMETLKADLTPCIAFNAR